MRTTASLAGLGSNPLSVREGFLYGLLGLPLAFCALPLYVLLPNLYAREFQVPLATLGALLLGSRLFDAMIDPLVGRWCDRLYAKSTQAVLTFGAVTAAVLGLGFSLLFFPPRKDTGGLLAVTAVLLVVTYSAYSALSVAHQSWGARLGGDDAQRSRIVAWREGLGLAGVVLASVTPGLLGLPFLVAGFLVSLIFGWVAWTRAVRPSCPIGSTASTLSFDMQTANPTAKFRQAEIWQPWHNRVFRRLLAVFLLNGIASAVPATLILFFIQDRLQATEAIQPLFLGSFFICGALSMPVWLRMVKSFGLARSWLAGMVLSIAVFLTAAHLGTGDTAAFLLVCALSGLALGSDLALPGALLARVIADNGDQDRSAGVYFGWWNFVTKLNLALAAGLALPLLSLFGYAPGTRDENGLQALTFAYCLLPSALKTLAALALHFLIVRPSATGRPK